MEDTPKSMTLRSATPADAAGLLAIYAPYVERTAVSFEWAVPDVAEFRARMGFARVAHFHRCGLKFGRWYDMIWMGKLVGPSWYNTGVATSAGGHREPVGSASPVLL